MYTDQPFLPISQPTVINNRNLNEDKESNLIVGQLPVVLSRYAQDDRWELPAALKPGHLCHPEWLATGEPWPNSLPPNVYGPSWIPECCGLFEDEVEGGFVVGGSVGDVVAYTDPAAGGLVVGGEAGDVLDYTDPAAGGLVVGGEAGDVLDYTDATAGGLVVGGEAGDVLDYTDATAGGLVVGGAVGDVLDNTDAAEGGVSIGGAAGDAFTPGGPTVRAVMAGVASVANPVVLPTRVSGDKLRVWLYTSNSAPAANSGWTRIYSQTDTSGGPSQSCYTKTSDGTDSTGPFTFGGANQGCYVAASVQNAPGATASAAGNGFTASPTSPTVSVTTAPALLCCSFSKNSGVTGGEGITPPSGQAPVGVSGYIDTFGQHLDLLVSSEAIASTGATGTRVASIPVSRRWVAGSVTSES